MNHSTSVLKTLGEPPDDWWGFLVYRTTYESEDDWTAFKECCRTLCEKLFLTEPNGQEARRKVKLEFAEVQSLEGASYKQVQETFQTHCKENGWVCGYGRNERCVKVDARSLRSVVHPDSGDPAYVIALDRECTVQSEYFDDDGQSIPSPLGDAQEEEDIAEYAVLNVLFSALLTEFYSCLLCDLEFHEIGSERDIVASLLPVPS
ncbi:hypothetical protein K402DRAFT_244391 [Aulographum hederae CBS 113979]|uniref:Uncharacterized protein n=1 Tax=Aulographum hederae CBS 113979 TaxID=1176131 RepID=A0A6G1H9X7_9PEZI|nr:hypothetical protein K402DRAFT_244391 [Aulographum hederae CBS 113979]